MTAIRISGVRPYDGEYEFDSERAFTTLEWRWVKKFSGYLPLTINEGFRNIDPGLFLALAVIAMHRAGKIAREEVDDVAEALSDGPFGTTITIVGENEQGEEEPVPLATPPGEQ